VRSVIRYCCPSNDNEKVLIVLLPGMDGTGILLRPFVELLPNGIDVKVVSYPEDTYLTYEQLAERVLGLVPSSEPRDHRRIVLGTRCLPTGRTPCPFPFASASLYAPVAPHGC
jgi:hypothetical protein